MDTNNSTPAVKQVRLGPQMALAVQNAINETNAAAAAALQAQQRFEVMNKAHGALLGALVLDTGFTLDDFKNGWGVWEGEGSGPDDEKGVFYLRPKPQ